jgi:nucleotide-binding universal stress UspA family protein
LIENGFSRAYIPEKDRGAKMRNILVAVDGSECSFRAVEYCGRQFSGLADLSIVLFHVMPNLPPWFWDQGHIPDEGESEGRREIVERWIGDQKRVIEPMFQSAIDMLVERGIEADRISTKTIYDSTDAAGSIVEEASVGWYLTLVIGRCGSSRVGGFFTGSTTARIINRGAGLAICVVE